MSDRIDEMVAAFRVEHDRARGDATEGRRRLLRAVERDARRRKRVIASAIVLALIATNSTTWAWSTGRLDPLVRLLGGEPELAREAPAPAMQHEERTTAVAREPLPASAEPHEDGARLESPPVASGPIARRDTAHAARPRSARDPRHEHAAHPSEPAVPAGDANGDSLAEALEGLEPPPPSADEADRRAFARAHRVHFDGGDPLAALGAWDRYLADFPEGRFVPEARFNRAVTLLRLHRDEEARAALQPFADGAYEGVRTREARALLEALDEGRVRR